MQFANGHEEVGPIFRESSEWRCRKQHGGAVCVCVFEFWLQLSSSPRMHASFSLRCWGPCRVQRHCCSLSEVVAPAGDCVAAAAAGDEPFNCVVHSERTDACCDRCMQLLTATDCSARSHERVRTMRLVHWLRLISEPHVTPTDWRHDSLMSVCY